MRRNGSYIAFFSRVHRNHPAPKILALCCVCFLCITGFSQNKITIGFKNYAGSEPLQMQHEYVNASGEKFTVRNFRYYISNIVLKGETGLQTYDEYFLVDEADSASKKVLLDTKLSKITAIKFLIGVDSLKNVTGVQTGDLDPAKGMFWTWNTGYVMAKLDGNAAVARTPQHAFSYHVGGYKTGEQTERSVTIVLPDVIDFKQAGNIIIRADIMKWFSGEHLISIAAAPLCHEPGTLAVSLADNYAGMFSIEEVK